MDSKINLTKIEPQKISAQRLVDTEFRELVTPVPTPPEPVSIEEFFRLYDELYLTIPPEGAIQSHSYLVNQSSRLINGGNNEEIQPLLNEITELRERLLQTQQEVIKLQIELTTR